MIKFLVLLIIGALPCFANVSQTQPGIWVEVDRSDLYFLSKMGSRKDRHKRKVMEMQNLVNATKDGVRSMELVTEYDCKKNTFRLINYRGFDELNLRGSLVYDWQGIYPRAFVGIPKKSPTEQVMFLVCGFSRKTNN